MFGRAIVFLLAVLMLEVLPPVAATAHGSSGVREGKGGVGADAQIRMQLASIQDPGKAGQRTDAGGALEELLMPDFRAVEGMQARKEAFYQFLAPLVREENRRLLQERMRILDLRAWRIDGESFRPADQAWLEEMAARYRVRATLDEPRAFFIELLTAVDVIPVSLALAQASRESALGVSQLAREGNNLFGQRCRDRACGVSGAARGGVSGRMMRFESVNDSVRQYIENLNVNPAYQPMRELRARLRAKGERPTGAALSPGLTRYSEMGGVYVGLIQSMIRSDDLARLDNTEYLP